MMELKRIRSERFYEYLRKMTPIDMVGFRLGDYAVVADENPAANYHVLMLTDNDRGFSYNMVMPWTTTVEPDECDYVFFIKGVSDAVNKLYEQQRCAADIPLQLANNYNDLQESGIDRYLDELAAIANGLKDHDRYRNACKF